MKKIHFQEIADFLETDQNATQFEGMTDGYITSMCSLQELSDHSICWIKNDNMITADMISELGSCEDILVVCPSKIEGTRCIVTDYPKGVFFRILNHFFRPEFKPFISDRATVLTTRIGSNVHIGANSYIGEEVEIDDNVIIHPNVSILSPCKIGHNCEIFPGAVIGADGFGYFWDHELLYRERHFRGVKIGNFVEIGANSCIDRGLLTDTIIGNYVKIDNLCHIGHNVRIEENCMIIAGTVICGSSVIRKNAYLAPASVVMNQITVGKHSTVGVNSAAIVDVRDGFTVFGTPAKRLSSGKANEGEK